MLSVRRIEVCRLDGPKRTPQGGIRVDAALTRSGILKYTQPDGSVIREYRPSSEVQNPESIATLASAPVTKLHPPEMVNRDNYQLYAKGHVGESVRKDGNSLAATMYLQAGDLADSVERGDMREVSCGYKCRLDDTPGIVPEGEPDAGERYDRVQRDIVYNHAAIVPKGRAGSEIALRLDSENHVISPHGEKAPTMKERIDGADYEIGTDAHRHAVERRDAAEKTRKAEETKLRADLDAANARAQAEAQRADAAETAEKARKDSAEFKAVSENAAKFIGAEYKAEGKKVSEIKRDVASKAFPSQKFDDAVRLDAFYDAACAMFASRTDSDALADLRVDAEIVATSPGNAERIDAEAAWEAMVQRNRNAWKKAPSATESN
jgi:hypothetical protein